MKKTAPRRLKAHITYLEMQERPRQRIAAPTGHSIALLKAQNMPVPFYRFLYEQVGKPHHWEMRRKMADAALAALIHAPTTRIEVLYVEGCPARFIEIDAALMPASVEIAYFGIIASFTGMGLGKWFLATAIEAAWQHGPKVVVVHTNTLDHPRALPLYQKLGFTPTGRGEEEVEAWE